MRQGLTFGPRSVEQDLPDEVGDAHFFGLGNPKESGSGSHLGSGNFGCRYRAEHDPQALRSYEPHEATLGTDGNHVTLADQPNRSSQIDISYLPTGLYLIYFKTPVQQTTKLIKQ